MSVIFNKYIKMNILLHLSKLNSPEAGVTFLKKEDVKYIEQQNFTHNDEPEQN